MESKTAPISDICSVCLDGNIPLITQVCIKCGKKFVSCTMPVADDICPDCKTGLQNCSKCGRLSAIFINGLCSHCFGNQTATDIVGAMYGWICPRCGVVHGPQVPQCHCIPTYTLSTISGSSDNKI